MKSAICGIDPHHASRRDAGHHGGRRPWVETHGYHHEVAVRRRGGSRSRRDEEAVPGRGATKRRFPVAARRRCGSRSRRDEDAVPGRGATIDGSRAFQRPVARPHPLPRRGATVDGDGWRLAAPGFMRRAATRGITGGAAVRGLKPTATIMRSRRDEKAVPGRAATKRRFSVAARPSALAGRFNARFLRFSAWPCRRSEPCSPALMAQ